MMLRRISQLRGWTAHLNRGLATTTTTTTSVGAAQAEAGALVATFGPSTTNTITAAAAARALVGPRWGSCHHFEAVGVGMTTRSATRVSPPCRPAGTMSLDHHPYFKAGLWEVAALSAPLARPHREESPAAAGAGSPSPSAGPPLGERAPDWVRIKRDEVETIRMESVKRKRRSKMNKHKHRKRKKKVKMKKRKV